MRIIDADINQGYNMGQTKKSTKIKAFVANLHANGQKPSERFGMSWNALSELEMKVPELTCRTMQHGSKTA